MSTELILFILALIAGYLYLNRKPEVVKQPVYRTQYVTEYVPVPVRRPHRRERFFPPRGQRRQRRPIRPNGRWPPNRQHEHHEHRDEDKPKGFIGGLGTPS